MKVEEFYKTRGWAQNADALDADGNVTEVDSPTACKFCLGAAIDLCYPDRAAWLYARQKVKNVLVKRGLEPRIEPFNDTATFSEILSLIQEAGV